MKEDEMVIAAEATSRTLEKTTRNKKKKNRNRGVAVVEIILILVILIAIVIIFKAQIIALVTNIWNAINKSAKTVY